MTSRRNRHVPELNGFVKSGFEEVRDVFRGLINYEDKVAQHWPEFAQNGKEEITLKMLLSHQGGLAALDEDYCLSWLRDDPVRLTKLLTNQRPLWKPGTKHGYHPITVGLYLDQIVRRVDKKHRSLSEYFKEEIAEPFGIDFHIGLPKKDQYRTARLMWANERMREYYRNTGDNFRGDPTIFGLTLRNVRDWKRMMVMHDPDFMELPCASSHGLGTAESVAKLHGILGNGGTKLGQRILSQHVTELLQTPVSWGLDVVYGLEDVYSVGMNLLPVMEDEQLYYMFGFGGIGGQFGAADTKYRVGWAYVTTHLDLNASRHQQQPRWAGLVDALYRGIHAIENIKVTRKVYRSFSEFKMPPPRSKL
ncbi:uncharacterized protein LOC121378660 isoform X2 [Gigantopelta aegis]|uniref:uncharacterized protein LOC121378660 isoform X2 n=1 Tax=Gigantopelta aegis TaxID=1735272 RepID=UPI001B88813B|nr:uncharacterized protein LOC121378660 isoform X2 [Gigantopelta aegis]